MKIQHKNQRFLSPLKSTIFRGDKKAFIWGEVALWIIALIVLVIVIIGIFMLKTKGINLIDKLAEILRFS